MKSEAYFHVTAENKEEYHLLINLGVPWMPPATGFIDRVMHTTFLIRPEAVSQILKQMANVESPRWCTHGLLDNEKICTVGWDKTCALILKEEKK